MGFQMKSILVGLGMGGLLLSSSACSFFAERPPPEAPYHHERGEEKPCKPSNIQYPIFDTISTLASVTWVVWANQKIDEAHSAGQTQDAYGNLIPDPNADRDDGKYKVARAIGYAGIGLYAASAIYGYVIESQCASYRKERTFTPNTDGHGPSRGFPSSALDFAWSTDAPRAAQTCRARGQEWSLEGATGLCQSAVPSAAHPDVKLDFELGHPASIIVVYRSAPQAMNENYYQIFAGLKQTYGAPQTAPAHISAACASSLAQCLEAGEHPTGPVWSWADGTIELAPVWDEDHALLELRYKRADTQTE